MAVITLVWTSPKTFLSKAPVADHIISTPLEQLQSDLPAARYSARLKDCAIAKVVHSTLLQGFVEQQQCYLDDKKLQVPTD